MAVLIIDERREQPDRRDERRQARALSLLLRELKQQHQPRHQDDAAADPKQAADHSDRDGEQEQQNELRIKHERLLGKS